MKTDKPVTCVVPILGDPVAQVATPAHWNAHFAETGQDAICVPLHIPREGLASFVAAFRHMRNMPGFLSTIPYKDEVAALCDTARPEVRFLGVANTVRRNEDGSLEGAMFDGEGMITGILARGGRVEGGHMLVIGAGAAGCAIALEAARRGAASIALRDERPGHAENQARRINEFLGRAVAEAAGHTPSHAFSVIVNASPLGSAADDPLPASLDHLEPAGVIGDAVTEPAPTRWITEARARGIKTVTGSEMAAAQAPLMRAFLGMD